MKEKIDYDKFRRLISSILYQDELSDTILSDLAGGSLVFGSMESIVLDLWKIRETMLKMRDGVISFEIGGIGPIFEAIKQLQTKLQYLNTQMEALSEGDFSQDTDYFGEFSSAFLLMKERLFEDMEALERARLTEQELKQHFKTIFHMIPEPTVITTLNDFRILDYNNAYLSNSGYTVEDIEALREDSIHIYTNDSEKRDIIKSMLNEQGYCENIEVKFKTKNDRIRIGLVSARLYMVEDVTMVVHVIRDITLLKAYERSIKDRETQLELIFENSPIGIIQYNPEGMILNINQYFCNLLDATREQLLNLNMLELPDRHLAQVIEKSLTGNTAVYEDLYKSTITGKEVYVRATFAPVFDDSGIMTGGIGIVEDYTERKAMEEEIRRLSVTDKLTQLYNRLKIDEVLEMELERAQRTKWPFGVILLDIDHFKHVNDNFGHQTGDKTLYDLSRLMEKSVREIDILGRWGGEEFIIIAPKTDMQGAFILAEKLRKKIETYNFEKIDTLTCSFGVAIWEGDEEPASVISRVDKGLYEAKAKGRNRVVKVLKK
ncbi:sensor domain-containing diguanylate cyclase [Petrocella sp. FN5]|uniref:sensor domain-containing diguanylate cyclase n=1 Tax=Petrocella sp. FN5 TaxID=3032002 RepID=UPI0023DC95A4|nr:diguanylate cyclase [Petrocella sp. FN5]MDF1616628.1 diguanylate cyclase [Petrocella sp. FN5]